MLFCLFGAWSFAQPLGSSNDESAQLIKAASVVRGQIVGPALTPTDVSRLTSSNRGVLIYCNYVSGPAKCDKALTVVTVPDSFANYLDYACYSSLVVVPAGCARGFHGSGRPVPATTYVGRYPPLYYALVGVPSLASHTGSADYAMRLVSGFLSALFLGLAFALSSLWSRSRLLPAAIAVGATPSVFIFGSVVNPSGLEMTTAICVWTGGLILTLDRSDDPPPALVAGTALAAVVMVLLRGLSPLWLAVILASLFVLTPSSARTLARSTSVRWAGLAVGVAGAAAVAYVAWAHALDVYPIGQPVASSASEWSVLTQVLGKTYVILQEGIGTFGWGFTRPPLPVTVVWAAIALTVVAVGVLTGHRRHAAVIIGLSAAAVVLPAALMVSQAHRDGIVWQARDGFPLYVGIALVSGAVAGRRHGATPRGRFELHSRSMTTRLVATISASVAFVQLGDFYWALRRYTVGLGVSINPLDHVPGRWIPPINPGLLLAVVTVTVAWYGYWIVWLSGTVPIEPRTSSVRSGAPIPNGCP